MQLVRIRDHRMHMLRHRAIQSPASSPICMNGSMNVGMFMNITDICKCMSVSAPRSLLLRMHTCGGRQTISIRQKNDAQLNRILFLIHYGFKI